MAFQPLLRHPAVSGSILATGIALYPKRRIYADEPEMIAAIHRKPIYDTPQHIATTPQAVHATTVTTSPPPPHSTSPSPTDRLAAQIKQTRLFLHGHAANLEDGINNLMTRFLHLESSFTSTVASLAPPRESNERLLPGGIYVVVAAMAGSIITRNRNILLRATVPVATGVGAGYVVLPITTTNVGNLIWKYEEKYPVIRDNHLRVTQGVRHFLETGKAHSQMGLAMAEEKVVGVKEAVEQWVKQGK